MSPQKPSIGTLTLQTKHAYGQVRIYPACSVSRMLAKFACIKVFMPKDIQLLQEMGYELKILPEPHDIGTQPKEET